MSCFSYRVAEAFIPNSRGRVRWLHVDEVDLRLQETIGGKGCAEDRPLHTAQGLSLCQAEAFNENGLRARGEA